MAGAVSRSSDRVIRTALAAILAMIPLAQSLFWGPMAIVIAGGLAAATLLTLLFLPALYAVWFRVKPPRKIRIERPATESDGLVPLPAE